jgi:hypothetical protein
VKNTNKTLFLQLLYSDFGVQATFSLNLITFKAGGGGGFEISRAEDENLPCLALLLYDDILAITA